MRFKARRSKVFIGVLVFLLSSLLSLPLFLSTFSPVSAKPANRLTCQDAQLPVKLSKKDSKAKYHIFGSLCYRGSLKGKPIQVLIHGITYYHQYWHFPFQPTKYSYVEKITDAGYVTFNIDRIGIGKSSRPPAENVNLQSNSYVLHQIVKALRSGVFANTKFSKVILVGHSYGSVIALHEAANHQDVDGLILTGALHKRDPKAIEKAQSNYYPAQQDPKFRYQQIPEGYLTSKPGVRKDLYYNQKLADPKVIAYDEKLKQTVTITELATIEEGLSPSISQKVKVPILLVIGEKDNLFCNQTDLPCTNSKVVYQREKPYFHRNANLKIVVIPQAGHDLNLHKNVDLWYKEAKKWSLSTFPPIDHSKNKNKKSGDSKNKHH